MLKTGFPFIGNGLYPLAENVLIPLGLTARASATYATIHKKLFRSGCRPMDVALRNTTLIISNEEMNDIIKRVRSTEESGVLTLILVWGGGIILSPSWFSLNNSKTIKAVTLLFCSIQ